MAVDDDLPFGLYEQLVTAGMKERLLRLDPERARIVRSVVDPAESHSVLARHVRDLVAQAREPLTCASPRSSGWR
jgi:hypothetical protein